MPGTAWSAKRGHLSRHLAVLEEAGLIQIERGYHGRRPKTWIRITRQGQEALAAEIAALQQLLRGHQHSRAGG
ncbi:transcriptional regulator [Micromonospora sp. NPDC094482]|uniref:transcriptional regulator n=1 Tax=Micromonospora sp. NPDC094482 TaxID=3155081 RepID=UPI0033290414